MSEPTQAPSWSKIRELLDRVLDHPAAERTQMVAKSDANSQLKRAVLSMLVAYEEETEPFGRPVDVQGMLGEGWRPGDVVGAYRLIDRVGEGGMGTVFTAQRADDAYSKKVAIKLIRRGWASDEEIRRFRSERQILADLEHPSIARLLDGGETNNGQPYLVMEFVDGQPISAYCRQYEPSLEVILELFLEVCRAVQFAHQSLIVHRDLKPSNILVSGGDGDERPHVKLLDFGIAKILEPGGFAGPVEKTRTGSMPMTPAYASPEQVSGEPITTATDVYSLGMLLYLLLTGDLPYRFDGHDLPAIVEAVVHREVTAPSHRLRKLQARKKSHSSKSASKPVHWIQERTLRGDLDAIVLKALAKEPTQRYATAEQLADDLERYLEHRPVRARRDTLVYRSGKFLHRYRFGLLAAATIFSILVVAIFTLLSQQEILVDERNHAFEQRRRAETVTGFLIELFQGSDPGRSYGEQVTARELLDKSSQTIDQELADQPQLLPELLGVLAETYSGLGQLEEAHVLAMRAIERIRLLSDDGKLPEHLFRLSDVLSQQGRYRAAHIVVSEALTRLDAAESREDRLLLARCLARRGRMKSRLGHRQAAEQNLGQALELARELGDDEVTAGVLEGLGSLRDLASDLAAAGEMYKQALELRRKIHDKRHPRLIRLESMIASLEVKRDPKAGEEVLRRVIENQRRLFGGPHPMLAISTNNLGGALVGLGALDEAEKLYRESLEMKSAIYENPPPSTATTMVNLANLRQRRGDATEAEALYRQALEIFAKELGTHHPSYAQTQSHLAGLMIGRNDLETAAPLLNEALEVVMSSFGPGYELALEIRNNLGEIARRQGRLEQARQILLSALKDAEKNSEAMPAYSRVLFNLAALEAQLGNAEESAKRYLEVAERDGDRTLDGLYALTHASNWALKNERFEDALRMSALATDGLRAQGDHDHWLLATEKVRGQALIGLGRAKEGVATLQSRVALGAELYAAGTLTEERLSVIRDEYLQARGN